MIVAVKKYNPGFLTDEQVIESFCVRTNEFESITESLRENTGNSNPHTIVIGPRGSGKTHLLMRIAAEVRRNAVLNAYFPIIFPEESYEVSTCGELWLECLHHLAQQAPSDERNNLELTHNDLRNETNDQVLAERCIGALLDFADRHQKRLLLVVENLNMLFDDIGEPEVGWRLRKTLQTEPRIMLLASATSRFDEIDDSQRAMYDLFRVVSLCPLVTDECMNLWQAVSGLPTTLQSIRPLEILTGGNPRLITIIATFGAGRSFQELMDNLLDLVDDHTEYFKSHLEHLPPQERRVYLALARLWKPATTKEVADLARVNTNQCSALLKRLADRGAVTIEGGTPRRREYYLTERLYNIYYLLRRGSGTQRVVEALIDFMVSWYSPDELLDIVERTYLTAYASNIPPPDIFLPVANASLDAAYALAEQGDRDGALSILGRLADRSETIDTPESQELQLVALEHTAALLTLMDRSDEAIEVCELLVGLCDDRRDIVPRETLSYLKGRAFTSKGVAFLEVDDLDAIRAFESALTELEPLETSFDGSLLDPAFETALLGKSLALWQNGEPLKAISPLDVIIERNKGSANRQTAERIADVIVYKSRFLSQIGQALNDDDIALLLELLKQTGLPASFNDALIGYIRRVGPATALMTIQESGAAEVLSPFVTALQQELGEKPRVPKEVEEVAKDIRERF